MHSYAPTSRGLRWVTTIVIAVLLALVPALVAGAAGPAAASPRGLHVDVTLGAGVVDGPVTGRLLLLVAARGNEPLDDVWVEGSRSIFGQNVNALAPGSSIVMEGGGGDAAADGVYGYPYSSLADLPDGDYTARAFLVRYDAFSRSDGSEVELYRPCGDGGSPLNGPGNLMSAPVDFTVSGDVADLDFTIDQERPVGATSPEIGGCHQGNYTDHDNIRYVKIRSERLSEFWGTDMYIGANVRLPVGYDPTRADAYPVIYSQGHWPGDGAPFWDNGETRFISVSIRQESPYYDDAYSVNSANLGPWGDAIAEELVPEIDRRFHTIAAPYGRLQEGGSTGGWTSLASLMFRPDVYGATWSYYPDPLDFHAHQAVDLHNDANAYVDQDGNPIGSWRDGNTVTVTMEQENHYELALGTNSRSFDQWDVWNAVFSPQGYNGYPLDPWDKVDGTIDHDTAALWEQQFDLTAYLRSNWSGTRDLGRALDGRIHVSVGTLDNYFLNGGVQLFGDAVSELGGTNWAEVKIVPGLGHWGFYDYLSLEQQLDEMWAWVQTHAPNGTDPLTAADTAPSTEGNIFSDVLAWGGRSAAEKRQVTPTTDVSTAAAGDTVTADFGAWDPGMALSGQWTLDGQPVGDAIDLGVARLADVSVMRATHTVTDAEVGSSLAFTVTGTKRGYTTETRETSPVTLAAAPVATPSPSPTATPAPTIEPSPAPTASPSPTGAVAGQPLAQTGGQLAPPLAIISAAAALGVGILFIVWARRRVRAHR